MLIAGIVCLVLAAAAAGYAWWQDRKHDELSAVEASTCGDMRQLADAVSVSAGAGGFRQRCELNGTAQPAYVGTVQAPQTKKRVRLVPQQGDPRVLGLGHGRAQRPQRTRAPQAHRRDLRRHVGHPVRASTTAPARRSIHPDDADMTRRSSRPTSSSATAAAPGSGVARQHAGRTTRSATGARSGSSRSTSGCSSRARSSTRTASCGCASRDKGTFQGVDPLGGGAGQGGRDRPQVGDRRRRHAGPDRARAGRRRAGCR